MPRPRYVLTTKAADQFDQILYSLAEHSGWDRSMDLEQKLYAAFSTLAANPGLGHLREDLASRSIGFYFVDPYQILFLRDTDPVKVIAIYHSARDIRALMHQAE